MRRFAGLVAGHTQETSLRARVMRSSFFTVGGFGMSQLIRLGSNLILTRLLYPEAFGLMALIQVVLMGLAQFSDTGVVPGIMRSPRGDEPGFLNTAWTMQVVRGAGLWLVACALAMPFAWLYGTPELGHMLPVVGITLLIDGFRPTRMVTANRHLLMGRVMSLEILGQIIGTAAAIFLAWQLESVWALVFSSIVGAIALISLNWLLLPGHVDRFQWESDAVRELFSFGKWVFLATVCGFFFSYADKFMIGKFAPLDLFGIYNIGYFWAAFPMMLAQMSTQRLLIPIYRETPPTHSRENFLKLRRMRIAVTGGLLVLSAGFAFFGDWFVQLLYDDRYTQAGAVSVLVACAQMPSLIVMTYDQAALAAGDSKRFFVLALARAILMNCCLLIGLQTAGLLGAILGMMAAYVLAYPVVVWLARNVGAWDGPHDAGFAALAAVIAGLALWVNWDSVIVLASM
jgi:O-antigen/teichoic acid export membrane protein